MKEPRSQSSMSKRDEQTAGMRVCSITQDIDQGAAIGEPPGGALDEVDAVRPVVGPGEREDVVVVAVVHQGVPEDEEAGHLRGYIPSSRHLGQGKNEQHELAEVVSHDPRARHEPRLDPVLSELLGRKLHDIYRLQTGDGKSDCCRSRQRAREDTCCHWVVVHALPTAPRFCI